MKNNINIKFMSDGALETFKTNTSDISNHMRENIASNAWIKQLYKGKVFIEKKYTIEDFELKNNQNNDSKVDFDNSVILYEHLKDLPNYILTDERFWAWLNFDKCYKQALQAMPIGKTDSTVKQHYLFGTGKRRGIFFGVLSRCFFRIKLTIDEKNEKDPYYLSRFVIDNPERFRNLTWRSFSSQKHIVFGVLKAEKRICDEYEESVPNQIYPNIAKFVSKIGGVRLLDVIPEEFIEEKVYNKMKELMVTFNGEEK